MFYQRAKVVLLIHIRKFFHKKTYKMIHFETFLCLTIHKTPIPRIPIKNMCIFQLPKLFYILEKVRLLPHAIECNHNAIVRFPVQRATILFLCFKIRTNRHLLHISDIFSIFAANYLML